MADDRGAPETATPALRASAPARVANRRKVTAIFALMFSVVPISIYAYNVERNVRARKILDVACRDVRAAREAHLSAELIPTLFEGDAPVVREALRESIDRPCDEADARLLVLRLNLRDKYALARTPARAALVSAVLERAEARCPALMAQAFDELPGNVPPERLAARAEEACKPIVRAARELTFVPEERYSAWQWAARMAAVADSLRSLDTTR
jgi:hypothetical protein